MREGQFQTGFIKKVKERLPGAVVIKNDSGYQQGIPDLTVLYGKSWAAVEVKIDEKAPFQPNQEYYLEELGKMGFSAVVFPQNEEEVLDALQQALKPRRASRVPKR